LTKGDAGGPVQLRIEANPHAMPRVREAFCAAVGDVGFAKNEAAQLCLAIDEAIANVIKHGYGGTCDKPIDVSLTRVEHEGRVGIRVTIRDFGRQVDPSTIVGRDLDDVRPGGLGVHIIRTVMDDVAYKCPEDGGMCVTMVKWVKS
jgi:anti-sigma regulatory factor (Ser/Thr protein kinase)